MPSQANQITTEDRDINLIWNMITGAAGAPSVSFASGAFNGTPWIDVKHPAYGAKGDGVADDTTAIQNALSAVLSTGGVVFLPAGTYLISNTLTMPLNKAKLLGAGTGVTTIKVKNSANLANIASIILVQSGSSQITIEGFTIDGNRANQSTGGFGIGIANQSTTATTGIVIRDVEVFRASQTAFTASGQDIVYERCKAEDCGLSGFLCSYNVRNPNDTTTGNLTRNVRYTDCLSQLHTTSAVGAQGFDCNGPGKVGWGTLIREVTYTNCHARQIGVTGTAGPGGWAIHAQGLNGSEAAPYNNPAGVRQVSLKACTSFACADGNCWVQGATGVDIDIETDGNIGGTGVVQRGYGIELQCVVDVTVRGTIKRSGNFGIAVHTDTGTTFSTATSGVLIDAVVEDCGYGDFSSAKQGGVRVLSDATGQLCTGVVVQGVIRNNQAAGVSIEKTSDVVVDAAVFDNGAGLVSGAQQGVVMLGDNAYGQLTHTVIMGSVRDTRSGASRTQLYGVQDNAVNVGGQVVVANVDNHPTANVSLAGNNTVIVPNQTVRFLGGPIQLDNNQGYQEADSGGTQRVLLNMDASNVVRVGVGVAPPSNGHLLFMVAGAEAGRMIPTTLDANFTNHVYPGTPAGAQQSSAGIFAGNGAPSNTNGNNGDFYFRGDGTKAGSTVIYHKEAGAWVALAS
jgi:hypothetical protein